MGYMEATLVFPEGSNAVSHIEVLEVMLIYLLLYNSYPNILLYIF